jgi:Na+/phosphate symporter
MQTNNTTNMKDKFGNALKVGDRVVYCKGTEDRGFGTVIERFANYGEVWVKWDSNNSNLHCESETVELIKELTKTSSEFTPEDESLLQQLLAKKEKYSTDKEKAERKYLTIVNSMYTSARAGDLHLYIEENIDQICDTLQTYKKYFG